MSEWQNKLDLRDLWKKYNDEKITVKEVAKEIAERIRKMKCYKEYEEELEAIAFEFEQCEDVDEFDGILDDLYDWADTSLDNKFGGKKVCWIATTI